MTNLTFDTITRVEEIVTDVLVMDLVYSLDTQSLAEVCDERECPSVHRFIEPVKRSNSLF
ncbi:hypothetical protein [Mesorhizobium sp. 43Arga]